MASLDMTYCADGDRCPRRGKCGRFIDKELAGLIGGAMVSQSNFYDHYGDDCLEYFKKNKKERGNGIS